MLQQPAVAMLNHLLAQSGWALPRLAKFSGKTARFNLLPFSFACTIQHDGSLLLASPDASADATCTIPPALLPRLALQDESALELIGHSGDTALVEEIFFLVRNLRWDAADDLSRVTGDIAAERIVQFIEGTHRQVRGNALRLSQALAEYWTEERPLIATPRQIAAFSQGVVRLQDSIDALEQRINRISKAG
ncbi:MAG TPA: SCP2 sterol-binding domain-containing protein [Gallionellaceae bacterium]